MTQKETRLVKRLIRELISVGGQCKVLSLGDECKCALCQVDNINPVALKKAVTYLVKNRVNENQAFLMSQIPPEMEQTLR